MPKISVIVPVYGVASYIEQCVRSLFEQTLNDIEYIFVNDCTPDDSMEILYRLMKEYPKREKQTTILHHEYNRGSVAARKTAIAVATGDYIIACDSDDWVEPHMYEEMYSIAKHENADMVWCDYYREFTNYHKIIPLTYSCEPVVYTKGMMAQRIPGFLWNKLFRKELYQNNVSIWTEGADMWEDLCLAIPMTHCARTIAHLAEPLYHYRCNMTSIARSLSKSKEQKRRQDMICNVAAVTMFLQNKKITELYIPELYTLQLTAKYSFFYEAKFDLKKWKNTFSEANKYIWQASNFSFYPKLLQCLARYNCSWFYILRDYLRQYKSNK